MGLIPERRRDELEEAFRFLWHLRLSHHVEQVERGELVDDFIDPGSLAPIARQSLSAALHEVDEALGDLERHRRRRHT